MTPFQDHEEIFEEMQDKSEKKKGKVKEPETEIILPVLNPKTGEGKKAKRIVKTARAGGYIKAADGCAQRGKTRGRMV